MLRKDFESELWSLMYEVKMGIQNFIEPVLQSEGLSMIQTYIIVGISKSTITNISSLCKSLGLNQGNVSTICKNLEKEGLIERKRSSEDERIVTLSLTEKGNNKIITLRERVDELNIIFDKVPTEKFEVIINGFHEFSELIKILPSKNNS